VRYACIILKGVLTVESESHLKKGRVEVCLRSDGLSCVLSAVGAAENSEVELDEHGPVHDVEHAEREREEDAGEAVDEEGPVPAPLVPPLLPTQPLAQQRRPRRRRRPRQHRRQRRRRPRQLGRLRAAPVALVVARRPERSAALAAADAGQRVRRLALLQKQTRNCIVL